MSVNSIYLALYIVLFLHQTTTATRQDILKQCCISYYSYIKPQLVGTLYVISCCCISYYSYIKPQQKSKRFSKHRVVYRTIPTSNHNLSVPYNWNHELYIVLFLHQTTTWYALAYLLHGLYIVLFLHQTTTLVSFSSLWLGCISYYSYIKPQP